jgi:hypothetical protein
MTMPLSQQCSAKKKNGQRCGQRALPHRETCVQHTPRSAMPRDEIDVLKRRLLALTKSKNERTATRAALSLSQLMVKFPPKSSTARGSDLDLRTWTSDERARLSAILGHMKALKAEVKARLETDDELPVTVAKAVPAVPPAPMEAPGVEPGFVAPSPSDLLPVMTANGPQHLTRRQLAEGWRVQ